MSADTERQEFEAWAESEGAKPNEGGPIHDYAWSAWQAARRTPSQDALDALRAARKCITTDRAALAECHFDYTLNRVDDDGQAALDEYDATLAMIDASIASPQGEDH